ncbi:MAG: HAD-IC family P-type ATPase, partial [Actinobacteria bacterium]|nr:HAD-IC family P-type ATPase [Actinomycetota bacterium]
MENATWHALEAAEVLDRLETNETNGLKTHDAEARLSRHGHNQLAGFKKFSLIKLFAEQFQDFMVLVLLGATAISYFLGEIGDAITIVAIVLLNAVLGFVQEFRAEKSLDALKKLAAPTAKVIRDGEETEIPATDVVPGDILYLEPGDRVPADARLISVVSLEVEEAALTGESLPVRKRTSVIAGGNAPLGDRRNMVYMGTTVTRGRGR